MPLYNPSVPSFTWANKPASWPTGLQIFITDAGTKGSHWFYDGTRWKPVNGRCVLASLDAATSAINNVETLAFQYRFPAAMLQLKDRLSFTWTATKSGTTDSATLRIRIGTAGTTGDALMNSASNTQLATTTTQIGLGSNDWRIETATTIQQLGVSNGGDAKAGLSAINGGSAAAAQTISNISNSLYWSAFMFSSGTTNTVIEVDARLDLIAPAN